ncbi:hypothetical protein LCGC14_0918570 [marine sediment metagenome]|uniref:Uncharacterized protein n=1 Tax=marine sediment metagenome TaxID=412755 RepID=A0A0F9NWA0_9ZZZZ
MTGLPNVDKLYEDRRKELLEAGHPAKMVQIALDWAKGSAEGMATYYGNEDLVASFLPRYLKDCEKWLKNMLE